MSSINESNENIENWVDPDIIAEYEGQNVEFKPEFEQSFKDFFESGYLDPKYDDLRERWDPLIYDPEHKGRLLGKVALWSVVRIRAMKAGTPFMIDIPKDKRTGQD